MKIEKHNYLSEIFFWIFMACVMASILLSVINYIRTTRLENYVSNNASAINYNSKQYEAINSRQGNLSTEVYSRMHFRLLELEEKTK